VIKVSKVRLALKVIKVSKVRLALKVIKVSRVRLALMVLLARLDLQVLEILALQVPMAHQATISFGTDNHLPD
jgi:hypothetical protein